MEFWYHYRTILYEEFIYLCVVPFVFVRTKCLLVHSWYTVVPQRSARLWDRKDKLVYGRNSQKKSASIVFKILFYFYCLSFENIWLWDSMLRLGRHVSMLCCLTDADEFEEEKYKREKRKENRKKMVSWFPAFLHDHSSVFHLKALSMLFWEQACTQTCAWTVSADLVPPLPLYWDGCGFPGVKVNQIVMLWIW